MWHLPWLAQTLLLKSHKTTWKRNPFCVWHIFKHSQNSHGAGDRATLSFASLLQSDSDVEAVPKLFVSEHTQWPPRFVKCRKWVKMRGGSRKPSFIWFCQSVLNADSNQFESVFGPQAPQLLVHHCIACLVFLAWHHSVDEAFVVNAETCFGQSVRVVGSSPESRWHDPGKDSPSHQREPPANEQHTCRLIDF